MDTGQSAYVLFLLVATALVFIDGQLIRRGGQAYLAEVYPDTKVATGVNRMITVLFHLTVLGLLALVSTIELNLESPLQTVVARLGVVLLVLAGAHALTMWALAKLRSRQREQRLQDELTTRTEESFEHYGVTHEMPPVPEREVRGD